MLTTSAKRLTGIACLLALGAAGTPADAVDPPKTPATRVDAFGDPLPDGAVARLGSLRLVHPGGVSAVAVSPDGKLLASGVHGRPTFPVPSMPFAIGQVKGGGNAPAPRPRGVRLWDTGTGKLIRDLETPGASTSSLCFSADGAFLYGACGNSLCCWDPHTGAQRWEKSTTDRGDRSTPLGATQLVLTGDRLTSIHAGHMSIQINRGNGSLGTSHAQMAVRFWNRHTGAAEALPAALASTNIGTELDIPAVFHQVVVSADGRFAAVLASAAQPPEWMAQWGVNGVFGAANPSDRWHYPRPRLRIVELGTGAIKHDLAASKTTNARLIFADDGSRLGVAVGKELWHLDVATGNRNRVAGGLPNVQALRFVPGTTHLAVQFFGAPIRVWDYRTGRAIVPHRVRDQDFQPDTPGSILAAAQGNTIVLKDRATGKALLNFAGHRATPSLHFAAGPGQPLYSRDNAQLHRWDPTTGKLRETLALAVPTHTVGYYGFWIVGVQGSTVAPAAGVYLKADDKAITIHDLKTHKVVRTLGDSSGKQRTAVFAPSGTRVVSLEPKQLVFFDVATGKRIVAIPRETQARQPGGWAMAGQWNGPGAASVVSPRGRFLATADNAQEIKLVHVDTGKPLWTSSANTGVGPAAYSAIAPMWFSPDERYVLAEIHRHSAANASEQSVAVGLWDVESGARLQELTLVARTQVQPWHHPYMQSQTVGALAVSPDRRLIALARNGEGAIELWDTASGTRRGVLPGHAGAVTDLAFAPDGRYLASASDDTTVLVWDPHRPLQAKTLAPAAPAESWRILGEPDAAYADMLIWRLVHEGTASVAFLRDRLQPKPRPDPKHLARLMHDLDSDDFGARAIAHAELAKLHDLALGALRAGLKQPGSLERRRRLEQLITEAQRAALPFSSRDAIREWRALEILERIGTPDAAALLRDLAAGAPGSPLTVHAAEALARLQAVPKS